MTPLEQDTISLKFRLGELTLFSVTRRLLVRGFSLNNAESTTQEFIEKMFSQSISDGLDGILLRSAPTTTDRPRRISISRSRICYVPNVYKRYFVDLSLNEDEYLNKFSSKTRSTLRRKVRKLAQSSGGSIDWRQYRTSKEMQEFYDQARAISAQTYQEKMFDAGLPSSGEFQSKMLADAQNDSVRGYLIFLEGKPIAYLYCPIHDGVVLYEYLGFLPDDKYSKLSPGTVLLWLVLQDFLQKDEYRYFDFTEGSEDNRRGHKGLFSTGYLECADTYVLRRSTANIAVILAHAGSDSFSGFVGNVLEKMGIKAYVKKIIRIIRGTK